MVGQKIFFNFTAFDVLLECDKLSHEYTW